MLVHIQAPSWRDRLDAFRLVRAAQLNTPHDGIGRTRYGDEHRRVDVRRDLREQLGLQDDTPHVLVGAVGNVELTHHAPRVSESELSRQSSRTRPHASVHHKVHARIITCTSNVAD